jgi:hypothetical protein
MAGGYNVTLISSEQEAGYPVGIYNSLIVLGDVGNYVSYGFKTINCAIACFKNTTPKLFTSFGDPSLLHEMRSCTFWNYGSGGLSYESSLPLTAKLEGDLNLTTQPIQSESDSVATILARVLTPTVSSTLLRELAEIVNVPSLGAQGYVDINGKAVPVY